MHTLRFRLILSHLIPILVIIPITGIFLVYTLETQVLLSNISADLTTQAVLMAQLTTDEPWVWTQPLRAQFFVARIRPLLSARLMLLSPDGRLLASSDPADGSHLGQEVQIYEYPDVQNGETTVHTSYSQGMRSDIADVFVPVITPDHQLIGVVRMTHNLTGVYERFFQLRSWITAILAGGLLLGVIVGWGLALYLERPLHRATQAVYQLARGTDLAPLPEQGPDEIRLLSSAVNTLVDRLHSLERSRKQLLANLVHELGRPLGALRSAIQALQGGADQDQALRTELLTGMDEETRRLQRLLEDLAHLHDQILGTLELDRKPLALSDWLPSAMAAWREAAQDKRLHWEANLPPDLPEVDADPDRLGQALGNLLSNAVKYTPAGGTVTITAGDQHEGDCHEAWIRVGDNGQGISREEQERIFSPFYRGKQGRRFPQGMGLGLGIAKSLVEAHGGRLELDSTQGLGSQFTIWLPLDK